MIALLAAAVLTQTPAVPAAWTRIAAADKPPVIGNGVVSARSWLAASRSWIWEIGRGDLLHGGVRYAIGRLSLQVGGGFDSSEAEIDFGHAETRGVVTGPQGEIGWHAFFCSSPSVLVVELTGLRREPGALLVWLPAIARPPGARPANGYAPQDLNPVPEVTTRRGGVDETQRYLAGGASAAALRRVLSTPDRKVYVLAVDRGDTPVRALSEAALSAERAASMGYPALLNAHRAGLNFAGPWQGGAPLWVRVGSGNGGLYRLEIPGWPRAFVRSASAPQLVIWPAGAHPNPNEFAINLPRAGWAVLGPTQRPVPPAKPQTPAPAHG